MTQDIVQLKPLEDYRLQTEFVDWEVRSLYLYPYLQFPVFALLGDDNLSLRTHVKLGSEVWTD